MDSFAGNKHYSPRTFLRKLLIVRSVVRDVWLTSLIIVLTALIIHDSLNSRGLMLGFALSFGYTFAFVLNDYFDSEHDKEDASKSARNVFVRMQVSRFWLSLGFFASLVILFGFAVLFGRRGIIALIVSLVIAISYSAKPIRLKSRPGLDVLSHGIFMETYPYALTVFLLHLEFIIADYLLLSLLFLNSIVTQIEQQLRDYSTDVINDFNFTIWIGPKRAGILLKILTFIMTLYGLTIIFLGFFPLTISLALFIALPFQIHRLFRSLSDKRSETLHRLLLGFAFIYFVGVVLYMSYL